MLHIIKLARKYLIKGNITVKNKIGKTFNRSTLEEELHLGLSFNDVSSLSFIKDFYPIQIFDISNLITLYNNKKYDEYFYFLPFCLWIESITSPHLKKQTRLHFLETAFQFFYYFYHQHQYSKFEKGITSYVSKKSKGQFLNFTFIKRCMNTVLISYSLIKNRDNIGLNRIGSHPLENYYGQIRGLCKNFDSYENFIRCSIKIFENLIIRNEFKLNQLVKNRINVAGTKIIEDSGKIIFTYTMCSPDNILSCAACDAN